MTSIFVEWDYRRDRKSKKKSLNRNVNNNSQLVKFQTAIKTYFPFETSEWVAHKYQQQQRQSSEPPPSLFFLRTSEVSSSFRLLLVYLDTPCQRLSHPKQKKQQHTLTNYGCVEKKLPNESITNQQVEYPVALRNNANKYSNLARACCINIGRIRPNRNTDQHSKSNTRASFEHPHEIPWRHNALSF